MAQLRPQLASAAELVARVARQRAAGYRLLAAWRDGVPIALAGYRAEENLTHGRFLYLDGLVTTEGERRSGIGAAHRGRRGRGAHARLRSAGAGYRDRQRLRALFL